MGFTLYNIGSIASSWVRGCRDDMLFLVCLSICMMFLLCRG